MQNLNTFNTTGLNIELFHIQTNTPFDFPLNLTVFHIGKPNDQIPPDIDVYNLPNADVVSRIHAKIHIDKNNYYIEDLGSSNGTFVNNTRLKPNTLYQINLGDKINLGQGEQVTFIFQNKLQNQQNLHYSTSNHTTLQSQTSSKNKQPLVDKTTKIVGLSLMVGGIVILTSSIQVGLLFRIPGILLCCAGIVLLFQRRINPNIGWVLIALGIAVIAFTANIFASVNPLVFLISSALFLAGYQLFSKGKILSYDLRSLQNLVKK